jgi:hypothetical protein
VGVVVLLAMRADKLWSSSMVLILCAGGEPRPALLLLLFAAPTPTPAGLSCLGMGLSDGAVCVCVYDARLPCNTILLTGTSRCTCLSRVSGFCVRATMTEECCRSTSRGTSPRRPATLDRQSIEEWVCCLLCDKDGGMIQELFALKLDGDKRDDGGGELLVLGLVRRGGERDAERRVNKSCEVLACVVVCHAR